MTVEEQPLVKANVDVDDIGNNWALALVMLIELHEVRYGEVAIRRVARRLMERYAAEYFPAATLTHEARRIVHTTLSARYFYRLRRTWDRRRAFERYGGL